VIHQIRGFAEKLGVVSGHCGERDLDTFLADFLRDARDAGSEQRSRITVRRTLALARCDERIELRKHRQRCFTEAALGA